MALTRPKFAQFDTTITSITDPQLVLNRNSTLANVDIGFVFNRDGGTSANAAIVWQESSLGFVLATTSNSGVTNGNIALTDYANLKVSNLVANTGVYTDNLYFANGSPYLVGGGSGTVNYDASPTPPGSPQVGDFWYDTSEDILFQYTDDGVNNVWIDLSGSPVLDILNTANVISGNVYTDNLFYANGQPWQFGAGLPDKISSGSSNVTVTSGYVNIAIASSNVVSVGSNVEVSTNLLPSANITYDLGSASQRWRTLYLSGSTIDLGGALISSDADGFTFTAPSGTPVTLASNGSVTGTLLTNSQPNITSVGTLDSLGVTGNASVGNIVTNGYYYSNGVGVIETIDSSIVTANINMKSYVDSSTASNIATANTALKSYVDSVDSTKANIASPSFSGTVTAPNISVTSNLSVVGDFTVTGTTTTLNTENLSINDPLIYLGEDNSFDLVDIGLVGSYTRDSVYRHTGVIRDASDQTWKFFDNVIAEPTAVIDLGGASYASLLVGNLETTSNAVIGANIRVIGRLQDAAGVGGSSGQYLTSTGSGIAWTNLDISTDSISDSSLVSNVTAYANSVNVIVDTTEVADFTSVGLLLPSGRLTFGSTGQIKIGPNTGLTSQGSLAVAIGEDAGRTNQGYAGIGIGYNAGNWYQGEVAVAIGYGAGQDAQGIYSVAVGDLAGQTYQGNNAVSLGYAAGQNYQGNISIAIGSEAGRYNQLGNAVAIGTFAGRTDQATYTVAIGNRAGNSSQQFGAVAIGYDAGRTSQGSTAVAVGTDAGRDNQRDEAVAVGIGAGQYNQRDAAVAIGSLAGNNNQGISAVAIGELAATSNQGNNAVALGSRAGYTSQHDNSIVLNATGSNLNSPAASSFVVKPIRTTSNLGNVLTYSSSSGEIIYSNVTVTDNTITAGTVQAPTINATNGLIINNNTIAANVTIPTGSSAMSVGPITIAPGITVTIPAGSRHLIL